MVLLEYEFIYKKGHNLFLNDLNKVKQNLPIDFLQHKQKRISRRERNSLDKSKIKSFATTKLNQK